MLVFALISVPVTSQVFAVPFKTTPDVVFTDNQELSIKGTDSKNEMSKTKKVLIALRNIALETLAGVGLAALLCIGVKNKISVTSTTDKANPNEESTENDNEISLRCKNANCYDDSLNDIIKGFNGCKKSSFTTSEVKQIAKKISDCYKSNCSSRDIQSISYTLEHIHRIYEDFTNPDLIACSVVNDLIKNGKTVLDENGKAVADCHWN